MWELPGLDELDTRGWTRFVVGPTRRVATHVQELAENGVDLAHFAQTHSRQVGAVRTEALSVDGPELIHTIGQQLRMFGLADAWGGGRGRLTFSYSGLGVVVVRAEVLTRPRVSFTTILFNTPVDVGQATITAAYTIRRRGLSTWPLRALAIGEAEQAIVDDTSILQHKAHLSAPQLTRVDGPILEFRRWAVQFYDQRMPDSRRGQADGGEDPALRSQPPPRRAPLLTFAER